MHAREIGPGVWRMGGVDWNRRLFDALIPLPDGTTYNAYLVRGSEKTALLDTADPTMERELMAQLAEVGRIDWVVSHHAEQDHSGCIPAVLAAHPEAVVLCSAKARDLLTDHLGLDGSRIRIVQDGERVSLGDMTLQFVYTPWVHWPETMVTFLPERQLLFSCDFFGSHLATSEPFASGRPCVIEAAKRYYAEIMMPFRRTVAADVAKVRSLGFDRIAPSHGPVWDEPETILAAYEDWVSDRVSNLAVIPYVSMHGSTAAMVDRLVEALADRGVEVRPFELSTTDLGELAISLVDAATIVVGAPTVHGGAHPAIFHAVHLADALRPKTRYAAILGSYGWGTRVVEQIVGLIPNLKVELLGTVLCKGAPGRETSAAIEALAESIREKHEENT